VRAQGERGKALKYLWCAGGVAGVGLSGVEGGMLGDGVEWAGGEGWDGSDMVYVMVGGVFGGHARVFVVQQISFLKQSSRLGVNNAIDIFLEQASIYTSAYTR